MLKIETRMQNCKLNRFRGSAKAWVLSYQFQGTWKAESKHQENVRQVEGSAICTELLMNI